MLRLCADRSELRIVGDQISCPTYSQDITKAAMKILEIHKSKEFLTLAKRLAQSQLN